MLTGTVKWFKAQKSFGFIQPLRLRQDAFVHNSAVERAGSSTLNEGQKLSYELVANKRSSSLSDLTVASALAMVDGSQAIVSVFPR